MYSHTHSTFSPYPPRPLKVHSSLFLALGYPQICACSPLLSRVRSCARAIFSSFCQVSCTNDWNTHTRPHTHSHTHIAHTHTYNQTCIQFTRSRTNTLYDAKNCVTATRKYFNLQIFCVSVDSPVYLVVCVCFWCAGKGGNPFEGSL